MFNEFKRQKQHLPIRLLFHKVKKKKCSLSKTLSHQNHLQLMLFSHHRFHLLSFFHLPKMMILMTLLPFHQKFNNQAQRHNAYTITTLHLLIIGIVLSSYHCRHCHSNQWPSQQQQEWRSRFDGKSLFLWLMQCYDGKTWFLFFCHPLKLYMVQYRYYIFSLLYCSFRIKLKHQNPLLLYIRERQTERERERVSAL